MARLHFYRALRDRPFQFKTFARLAKTFLPSGWPGFSLGGLFAAKANRRTQFKDELDSDGESVARNLAPSSSPWTINYGDLRRPAFRRFDDGLITAS